jgi:pimeloyl-ACP methyl ester carboxylesterase
MEGVGHFLMMERPEEFNQLLRQVIAGLDQPAG